MTRKQILSNAEKILRRRRDALRQTVSSELSQFNTTEERVVGDFADAAIDDDFGTITSNLAELESRELSRVEHALERLREGTYGDCEECGRAIPTARLQALPYAATCIQCQQSMERGNRSSRPVEHWGLVTDRQEDEPQIPYVGLEAMPS